MTQENIQDDTEQEEFAKMFDDDRQFKKPQKQEQIDNNTEQDDTEPKINKNEHIKKEEVEDTEKLPQKRKTSENEESVKENFKDELEQYKKRYKDSKEWGQKTNITLINAKKKITDLLKKLHDDGAIYEDQYNEGLSYFNTVEESTNTRDPENQPDPHLELKQNLDKEFQMFKRYNKISNADEKYNSFFTFMSLSTPEEIEKTVTYMQEETPDKVIDYIMSVGEDLYEDLYKGIEEKGDVLTYVKELKLEKNKLAQKVKELQTELDGTTEKLYSRPINSKVSRSEPAKTTKEFSAEFFDR